MMVNRQHVTYSARHAGYIILDDHGRQQFANDGRPLVFSTRLDAAAAKPLTHPYECTHTVGMTTEPISRGDRITWERNGVLHNGRVEHIAHGYYMAKSDQGARDALRKPDIKGRT